MRKVGDFGKPERRIKFFKRKIWVVRKQVCGDEVARNLSREESSRDGEKK